MLKSGDSLNDLEARAADAVGALLSNVPFVQVREIGNVSDHGYDILVEFTAGGQTIRLVCEVKQIGQPRHVREAILRLRDVARRFDPPAIPVFIAPYLSPQAQALCREHGMAFLDLVGNARLVFDTVFIEYRVDTKPAAIERAVKSIFKPKSARILRSLLRDPSRAWRVSDLAREAGVSLGLVSAVRAELIDREWADVVDGGLRLSAPGALLDAWREVYEDQAGERFAFYTALHGQSFEAAARSVLNSGPDWPRVVFASFSAAHWLAPYGRVPTQYFFADATGLGRLRDALQLTPALSGANVVITVPKEDGLFRDTVQPAPGAVCTSPVQTYLDLAAAGERGVEAAEHLKREMLSWQE